MDSVVVNCITPNLIKTIYFIGMTLFAWRMNSNLTTNNNNNASVGRRDFEAAGALGVLCICNGILFVADFFYVMYQNVLHAPAEY